MLIWIFSLLFLNNDYMLLFILIEFYNLWILSYLINTKKYNILLYYFLYNAISSVLILMSLIFYQLQYNYNMLELIITIAFNIKLGIIPFHIIYILLYSYLSYKDLFILNIIPKLFIILILNKLYLLINKLFLFSNLLNYLLISFSNIYTNNFKKILILSSFTNLSLLIIYWFNNKSIYIWFIIILYILNNYPIFKLQSFFFKPIYNMFIIINILSLIGFPPLIGFLYKILILKDNFSLLILFLIFINSIISIFYYFKFIKFYNDKLFNNIEYNTVLVTFINIFILILI